MAITTVFQDAVPKTENRHYQQVTNSDGTISLIDVTEYEVEGTYLNAKVLNEYTSALNAEVENIVNKVDKSSIVETTLLATDWVDGVYTLTVEGVTETSVQEILPSLDITEEQLGALQGANIQDNGQSTDTILLKAFFDAPVIDVPIRVILRGDM